MYIITITDIHFFLFFTYIVLYIWLLNSKYYLFLTISFFIYFLHFDIKNFAFNFVFVLYYSFFLYLTWYKDVIGNLYVMSYKYPCFLVLFLIFNTFTLVLKYILLCYSQFCLPFWQTIIMFCMTKIYTNVLNMQTERGSRSL